MEGKIDYNDAMKAKKLLTEYIKQEVDIDYTEIKSDCRANERLLYLALNLEFAIFD